MPLPPADERDTVTLLNSGKNILSNPYVRPTEWLRDRENYPCALPSVKLCERLRERDEPDTQLSVAMVLSASTCA